ncbi:HAD family hydrolase [Corynebacterium breve]|uniref:HAD family hydrolase n=1 Tax=Corynebacterium breve TaxID=3049799 RepID=A0ABY8VF58_9CORY|nr:HAD family hydrolase [Corynebacterium breve]WIM68274.1 HAD family hydrolase [Corynebacterium breve]
MRGLIVDYVGVLDMDDEDQRRWRELLVAVREAGVATSILSNDPGGEGADHIREWEFRGDVDAVLLSGEIGAEKPAREAFQAAADAMDVELVNCVLIDDNILNIRGAVDNGLIGIYHTAFDRTVVEIQSLFDIEGEF